MNLAAIEHAIEAGKLQPGAIDEKALEKAGLVWLAKVAGVRVLGRGTITQAVTVNVSGASASARAAIEAAGGTITTTHGTEAGEAAS